MQLNMLLRKKHTQKIFIVEIENFLEMLAKPLHVLLCWVILTSFIIWAGIIHINPSELWRLVKNQTNKEFKIGVLCNFKLMNVGLFKNTTFLVSHCCNRYKSFQVSLCNCRTLSFLRKSCRIIKRHISFQVQWLTIS